jgi:hypothetical protein
MQVGAGPRTDLSRAAAARLKRTSGAGGCIAPKHKLRVAEIGVVGANRCAGELLVPTTTVATGVSFRTSIRGTVIVLKDNDRVSRQCHRDGWLLAIGRLDRLHGAHGSVRQSPPRSDHGPGQHRDPVPSEAHL